MRFARGDVRTSFHTKNDQQPSYRRHRDDQNEDRLWLGPSLSEQAPRSASTHRLSGINASASLHRTGPAPHGRGVARLLSDCHAAAVEAREGEAVEGFAQGSALVPQHADGHFLAERH